MNACMHACTDVHKKANQSEGYSSHAEHTTATQLGCLCTIQALEPCAGKSSWGAASNLQEDSWQEVAEPLSSTTTLTPLSETRTVQNLLTQFTSGIYQLMLQLGGPLSQLIPGHQVPI